MKYRSLAVRGGYIVLMIFTLSFSLAYAGHEISKYKKHLARVAAFIEAGIEVTFENRTERIKPIIFDSFAAEVGMRLATPLQEKQSARLVFEKTAYRIEPERPGLSLDHTALLEDLRGRVKTFSTIPIQVKIVTETADILESDLKPYLKIFAEKFNKLYTLKAKDDVFTVKIRNHLDWITYTKTLDRESGNVSIVPSLLEEPFIQYLQEEVAKKVNQEPATVKISRDEKGKIIFDGKGKNGLKVNEKSAYDAMVVAYQDNAKVVAIPVDEENFMVDISPDLQELGIREILSIGHTSYYGSPKNRMFNIEVGMGRFNGVLIPPIEVFSFNAHLGPVDGAHGFREELVIKPEGTIPEFGGGLCQVSTTAYRAALYAGLPITERSPHSYAVSYYSQIGGHGIDATIYPGARDLKFKNDTPGHLLLQAYTDGAEAYFIVYGTSDGRTVKMEGPLISNRNSLEGIENVETTTIPVGTKKQVEKSHSGFSTVWYRYITPVSQPGIEAEPIKETISSVYKATKEKYLIGIAAPAAATPVEVSQNDKLKDKPPVKSFQD